MAQSLSIHSSNPCLRAGVATFRLVLDRRGDAGTAVSLAVSAAHREGRPIALTG
ncbi:MAG: hypothetical protein LLG93_12315 [Deltaproteobacteria bacterium]|nr:hypothetical protein [Deltaproteobacteria bacterium]